MLETIKIVLLIVLCSIMTALLVAAAYHHIMLKIEKNKIVPIGTQVKVDGHSMNVYIEGVKSNSNASIVLLSGSGVASPLYDYKILYSKISETNQVSIVEKFGYGYSDKSGLPRDVATMVEEDRKALKAAQVEPPYVLMPHSMSALEAIYWAHAYPDEVKKLIGLDMAVPNSYTKSNITTITFMKIMTFFGVHRIPAFCSVNKKGLSDSEYEQNRMLVYRNSLCKDVYNECKVVMKNAKTVGKLAIPDVPILMFTTNLAQAPGFEGWVKAQKDFAEKANHCLQIELDCGHNLHYDKFDFIAKEINKFMNNQ